MRGKYLIVALLLFAVQNAQALQCADLFQAQGSSYSFSQNSKDQIQFWNQISKKVSDSRLLNVISKIQTWTQSQKEFSFDRALSEIKAQDRLPTLLYILSSTKTGRSIISKNLQNFEKYYDEKLEDIRLPLEVKACKMDCIAYFELMEEGFSSHLKLNKDLKLGTAVVVFGHELTHVYDFLSRNIIEKIPNYDQRHLFTEYNAYMNEKRLIRELLESSPRFNIYLDSVKKDSLNNLYTKDLTAEQFTKIMFSTDKVPKKKTQEFLEKTKNPNFDL